MGLKSGKEGTAARHDTGAKGYAAGSSSTHRRLLLSLAGGACLIAVWHVLSLFMPGIVLASPVDTLKALAGMFATWRFWTHLWMSFRRITAGVCIGSGAGFVFGLLAGLNEDVKNFLEPLRWVLMSVPAVVVVVTAMLWFGMGSTMVVFITALLISPIIYVNTVAGLGLVDENIVEMARLYDFSLRLRIRHVYIPALTGPLASAMVVAVGMGVRVVILAEVMGTAEGIGHALSLTRSNLEIPELFAWVVVCIGIVGLIEYAVLKPVEKYATRWRR